MCISSGVLRLVSAHEAWFAEVVLGLARAALGSANRPGWRAHGLDFPGVHTPGSPWILVRSLTSSRSAYPCGLQGIGNPGRQSNCPCGLSGEGKGGSAAFESLFEVDTRCRLQAASCGRIYASVSGMGARRSKPMTMTTAPNRPTTDVVTFSPPGGPTTRPRALPLAAVRICCWIPNWSDRPRSPTT